jgi:hypothetical protein
MNNQLLTFLNRLDKALHPFAKEGERFDMYLLGRAALMVRYQFSLATKDIDIVEMRNSELEAKAIELAGQGSELTRTLGLYLEQVSPGLPPLPGGFARRCEEIHGEWKVLRVWVLEAHDLAVTKLKSFRAKDRQDLQMLCDRGLLNAARLRESLDEAFPLRSQKPEDAEIDPDNPDWSKALQGYKAVEAYLNGDSASI